jgi:hypothetical protein
MPSTAISSAGARVYISTGTTAAKNITAITKANPCVVTSNAHGLAVGTVVVFASIAGMTELNGRAAVITAQDTNTFTLGGIDSAAYTTYTSGGTATPQTLTEIENVKSYNRAGSPAAEIDVTTLSSTSRERISGLADRGSVSIDIDIDHTGPGQAAARAAVGGAAKAVKVTLQNGRAGAVMISFNNFSDALAVDQAHNGSFEGFVASDYAWYS